MAWPPDLDTLKSRLGVAGTADDAAIADQLAAAAAAVRLHLGYDPAAASGQVAYLDGTGTALLLLPAPFVTAVEAVEVDETGLFAGGETALVAGDDYRARLPAGVLVRLAGGVWPYARARGVGRLAPDLVPARGAVRVTYSGGDADATAAAGEAACLEAAARYRDRGSGTGGTVTGESFNGASYTKGAAGEAPGWAAMAGLLSPAAARVLKGLRDAAVR